MPRKRPPLFTITFVVVAIAAGLALLQMTRHRLQANDAIRGSSTLNTSEATTRPTAPACTSAPSKVEPAVAASGVSHSSPVVLRLDYAGAEALIDALERDSISDADVDSLLRIRGVCAMVDNVSRFFPGVGVAEFREDLRGFVRAKKAGEYDGYFRLSGVWETRSTMRALVTAIRTVERRLVEETLSQLERYRPDTGTLAITAYFVAGGVSDGFAFENDPASLYANTARADGDVNGVVLNLAHEAYHVMQARAQAHAGLNPLWLSAETMPSVERLLAGTLAEGTANYVADPTRSTETGSNLDSARARYRRNTEPRRLARNFGRFDAVLSRLRDRRMTWAEAYREGFTSTNDASFYFVGYEMTRALDRYCGAGCIGRQFEEPPVEFFRRYIALYHQRPELAGRFSRETESFIAAYGATAPDR